MKTKQENGESQAVTRNSIGPHRENKSARPQVPPRTAKRGVDRPRGRLISKGIISARQREVVQKSASRRAPLMSSKPVSGLSTNR
jgi:hypothetical protein